MPKIVHAGMEWEAVGVGMGTGVGVGGPPDITHWMVEFICLSGPVPRRICGHISKPDPTEVSEDSLRHAFETALVADVLMNSPDPLTIQEIADRVTLEQGVARNRLHNIVHRTDVVIGPSGEIRYVYS